MAKLKMLSFSLRVMRMDRIRYEHIRGTDNDRCLGDECRNFEMV